MASRQTQLAGIPARLLIALVATGCAVGPKYRVPPAPATDGHTRETLPSNLRATEVSGGESQHFLIGHDPDGRWWIHFGALQLDSLEEALTHCPDLAAQEAVLHAAWEDARAAAGVSLAVIASPLGTYIWPRGVGRIGIAGLTSRHESRGWSFQAV